MLNVLLQTTRSLLCAEISRAYGSDTMLPREMYIIAFLRFDLCAAFWAFCTVLSIEPVTFKVSLRPTGHIAVIYANGELFPWYFPAQEYYRRLSKRYKCKIVIALYWRHTTNYVNFRDDVGLQLSGSSVQCLRLNGTVLIFLEPLKVQTEDQLERPLIEAGMKES